MANLEIIDAVPAGLRTCRAWDLAASEGKGDYTAGVRYCGDFYGQTEQGKPWPAAISVEALLGMIGAVPPGVTEIACHPASANDVSARL